jgi:hypothetical protein
VLIAEIRPGRIPAVSCQKSAYRNTKPIGFIDVNVGVEIGQFAFVVGAPADLYTEKIA